MVHLSHLLIFFYFFFDSYIEQEYEENVLYITDSNFISISDLEYSISKFYFRNGYFLTKIKIKRRFFQL